VQVDANSDRECVSFPGVLGHARARDMFARALASNTLHHATMLVGPRGVGKATLARSIASVLVCSNGTGCASCHACARVSSGNHPDVQWIVPEGAAGQIRAAPARELQISLQHAPYEARAHVVIIDPADALNEEASNILLKSIEEPRPNVSFFLITHNLHRLLPTIVSRCMPVRLGRLDDEHVGEILAHEADDVVDEKRRALAVRLADGSAGAALELAGDTSLDACLALLRLAVATTLPKAIFAGAASPFWQTWSESTAGAAKGKAARERAMASRMAELWLLELRERMRGRTGMLELAPAHDVPISQLVRRLEVIQRFHSALEHNPNVRLALEQLLLEVG